MKILHNYVLMNSTSYTHMYMCTLRQTCQCIISTRSSLVLWMDVHNCIATLASCDHTQEVVWTGVLPS